jgi:hypothetical protein
MSADLIRALGWNPRIPLAAGLTSVYQLYAEMPR